MKVKKSSYTCENKQSQVRAKGEGKTPAWDCCGVGQDSDLTGKNGKGNVQSIPRESPGQKFGNEESCK